MTEMNRTDLKALFLTGGTASEFDFVDLVDSGYNFDDDGGLAAIYNSNSTGLLTGGELSINSGDNTKFDISSGVGRVVDNASDPENPTYSLVTWSAMAAISVTNIAITPRSFIALNSSAVVVQSGTPYNNSDHKDKIILGNLGHANFTNLVAFANIPDASFDGGARLGDLARALGALNVTGNIYGPNGANLNLDKGTGTTYRFGTNFHSNKGDPDLTQDSTISTVPFRYSYQDGSGDFILGAPATAIDPSKYDDDSGTLAPVTVGYWTVQRIIYIAAPHITRIEYGQDEYSSFQAAYDNAITGEHNGNPAFIDGITRSFLIVKQGTADLSSSDNLFIESAKFGGSGGGAFATATVSLQSAYDNSASPEFITDGTRGPIQIRDGAAGGDLIHGEDSGGSVKFNVKSTGEVIASSLTVSDIGTDRLSVSTITLTGEIDGDFKISGSNIEANAISAIKIAANSVGTSEITASALSLLNNPSGVTKINVNANGDLVPVAGSTQNLGSLSNPWKDLYLSGSTLFLAEKPVLYFEGGLATLDVDQISGSANLSISGSNIAANSITSVQLATDAVTDIQIAANSVSTSELTSSSIKPAHVDSAQSYTVDVLTVVSQLIAPGSTIFVDASNLSVSDNIIDLNVGETGAGVSAGESGFSIDRGTASAVNLLFNEATDRWAVKVPGATTNLLVDAANEISTANISSGAVTTDKLSASVNVATLTVTNNPSTDDQVGDREYNDGRYLLESNNLSDLVSSTTSRTNLGVDAAGIKSLYESNSDTNEFSDAEQTKLSGIEASATIDQTASEILTAIKTVDGSGSGLDADLLDGYDSLIFRGLESGTNTQDPDLASEPYIVTNHVNSPNPALYWHIRTQFYSTVSSTANRSQIAIRYDSGVTEAYVRNSFSAVWSSWVKLLSTKADIDALNVDADTLDGLDSTSFLKSNAADSHSGNITPSTNNSIDLGSGSLKYANVYATTFQGESTSAIFADLAERYEADKYYESGTVVCIGGEKEITESTVGNDQSAFGIISTNPAFKMNSDAGDDTTHPFVALKGRVPCKVTGPIKKGQKLVTSEVPGHARGALPSEVGGVIGMSLEDRIQNGPGFVEVTVFRG